ncbi:TonB-dependent receptor, partial [Candidatus Poribacteria bacterium]|nr:TonB-dependent receptor [Candidatus Poribacteria bacterium]
MGRGTLATQLGPACWVLAWVATICAACADASAQSLEDLLDTTVGPPSSSSAASKYKQTLGEAPASVTILTSADIAQYGWRTLSEALQTVRGLYVRDDRNYSYLGARGHGRLTNSSNRVLLLINGHINNDDFYNGAGVGTTQGLNLDAIERIEVVRGPGSALYGTGAVFAVIDIITKDANSIDGLRFAAEGGSFGRKGLSGLYGGSVGGGAELTLSGRWSDIGGQDLYYAEYDDPSTNAGVAEGRDWDRSRGFHASLRAGEFSAQAMLSSRKTGRPTGAYLAAFNDPAATTLDDRGFLELRYTPRLSARAGVMARGYVDYFHHQTAIPYDELPTGFVENDSGWSGAEIQFLWDPREYNRFVVGVEAQRHFTIDFAVFDEVGTRYIEGAFPFTLLSAYAQNTYQPLDNLSLTAGVRADSYSADDDSVSPRVAVIYKPFTSTAMKLLYGEAFRVATRFERHLDVPGFLMANPLLRRESIRTAEAVWEQRIGHGLVGILSTYRYEMRDLIDATIDPTHGLAIFQNISAVTAGGVEAKLRSKLGDRGAGYASYAYQKAEDAESGLRLTNSPAHLGRAGIAVPVVSPLFAAVELIAESGRRTVQ